MQRSETHPSRPGLLLRWPALPEAGLALSLLLLGLWRLDAPAPGWDEGWTLSVARSFAERGFYGRLLLGQDAPPGLEASFWVTGPVALLMRLFGVGIWQGRLFGLLCLLLALAAIYLLARALYSRQIAWGTLAVLLLGSMHPRLHAFILARQVLAELPMLALLLSGYLCLLQALRGRLYWLAPAALLWALGCAIKLQATPFWAVSLLGLSLAAWYLKRRRLAVLLPLTLFATLLLQFGLGQLQAALLAGQTLPPQPLSGLTRQIALVLEPFNRFYALQILLLFGIPSLLGLLHAALLIWRQRSQPVNPERLLGRLALLLFSGSWLAWYLLLSVGTPRYAFPALFVAAPFVAAWLFALTEGYRLRQTLAYAATLLQGRLAARSLPALLALFIISIMLSLNLLTLTQYYLLNDDRSAQRVAALINTATPATARIETYESELHFLLQRPYHYPPDQIHIELNRRSLLGQQVQIDYDPLAADPDYLIVGRFTRENQLYDPILTGATFRLMHVEGRYEIYQRVR